MQKVFSTNIAGTTAMCKQNKTKQQQNKLLTIQNTMNRNQLKIYHKPKCQTKTIILLEENIGENICDLVFGKDFSSRTLKA